MENTAKNTQLPPFGIKDKIGYAAGDLANNLSFQLASTFLMVFYTDVLGIAPAAVGTLFLVSRIVDAFTDVTMGVIVDRTPATAEGKFRPWIKRIAGPVALASFLLYQTSMAGASMKVKIIYMYVTYLLWGSICYTAINIPYGSMASGITHNASERTELSVWRTRGSSLGVMFVGVLTPLIIYTKNAAGDTIIRPGSTFTIIAGVFSVLALVFYYVCYKFTTERVKIESIAQDDEEKVSLGEGFRALISNRSLIAITLSSIFLLMTMILMMSMFNYVFPYYYNSNTAIATMNLINPILSIFVISSIASWLGRNIGKKEASILGMLIGSVLYFVLYFYRPDNVNVFMAFVIVAYGGLSIFNVLVWATITDVIDDQEIRTGRREDGTVYAVNSFARKVGQALAGGLGGYALEFAGYDGSVAVQAPEVIKGIYDVTTLGPAVGFAITAVILFILYPLNKQRTLDNQAILAKRREERSGK